MTTALYRRYRPETFADVIGQEHVTEPLMQALRTGRVNHAYLFSGPRGCGKTTSARILARCLNCEQGPTPTPCGTCDSCLALARGGSGSIDVIEIDAASHGGVDDARDLRERASYGPAQSRYKVYIIDEAHMVTPQGFNALLKIVEEPPEHVKFVFATTEPEKVIGTIRSRTHHYPFRLVPPAKLTDFLARLCEQEGVAVAPGVLGFVVRAGGGSVRDSLSVLDQLIAGSGDDGLTYDGAASLLGFTGVELLDATVDALAAGDAAGVFAQVDRVVESGHDPRRFALDLLERLRDLIIIAAVPDGAAQVLRGIPQDQLERMRGQQARFGPGALTRAADIVNAGVTEMTGATAPRLQLELICARVLLPGASGEQGYAARLDRLERRLEVGGLPSPGAGPAGPPPRAVPVPPRPVPPTSVPVSAVPVSAVPMSEVTEAAAPVPAGAAGPATGSVAPALGSASGGIDVVELRRVWPEVLGRIFGMRRVTWTFLSQHARVLDYDGQRLVLGIATVGLANTFRQGNHAEFVRQALIDEIGLDVRVEGVPAPPTSAAAGPPSAAAAAGQKPSPPPPPPTGDAAEGTATGVEPPPASGPGRADAGLTHTEGRLVPAAPTTAPTPPIPLDIEPPSDEPPPPPEQLPPDDLDAPLPAPASGGAESPHAAVPAPAALAAANPTPGHVVREELARVKAATRRALDEQHALGLGGAGAAGPRAADGADAASDAVASRDDEDVADSADLGQTVIERVLGGRVLEQSTD